MAIAPNLPDGTLPLTMLTTQPFCANDGETSAPRKFKLEGVGEPSRGHAQQSCKNEGHRWRRHRGRPEADGCAGASGGFAGIVGSAETAGGHGGGLGPGVGWGKVG